MKILSVKLKSVIITALVMLAVVIVTCFTAHTLSDAVFANERMIPIYNVDTTENKVAITFNCAVGNSHIGNHSYLRLYKMNSFSYGSTAYETILSEMGIRIPPLHGGRLII